MQQIDSIDQRGCEIARCFDFLLFFDSSGGRRPKIPVMGFLVLFDFRTGFLFGVVLVVLLFIRLRVCRFVLNLSEFICR